MKNMIHQKLDQGQSDAAAYAAERLVLQETFLKTRPVLLLVKLVL